MTKWKKIKLRFYLFSCCDLWSNITNLKKRIWNRFFWQENEPDKSLRIDIVAMYSMSEKERAQYLADLRKRKEEARQKTL